MAKFDIKTVKPKFVVTTSPDNKIDVVVNKPIIESKNTKSFFQLKNTGGPRGLRGETGDPGQDGFSPSASVTQTESGATITITDKDGTTTADIENGATGPAGQDGYSPSATVTETASGATITITDKDGTTTAYVSDGAQGDPGFSPRATVEPTATGAEITITDEQGTTVATIRDGADGAPGADGYSPSASVTQTATGATITVTDEQGTTTADITNGTDGQDGAAATISVGSTSTLPAGSSATVTNTGTSSAAVLAFGIPKGDTGAAGADGFSPSASVTQTSGGATISVTDKSGTTTADIANGTDGQDGDAATIAVGTVTTLQPNQSAYVTNVGTSTAAIFDIGIPQGQKGESGSGSGDMSASDYDPNSTVKNAGGIPSYVTSQLPGDMTGATASTAGAHGLVPAPAAGDQAKVLKGDGTWGTMPSPELVEMSYGESNAWAKFIAAYNAHCIVYCRASSNANPATGSQTRKAFMAYVNNADSPTSVEFQYYRSVSSHSDSQQGDQVFVYSLTSSNGGTWSVTTRNSFTKIVAGTNMTSSYSSGALTLDATQPTVNDATLTIQKNGTDVQTFTANQSTNATANITVPTDTSDLTNGAGYITSSSLPTVNDATLTIQQNGTTVQTFTANQSTDATANISVPTQLSDLDGTVSTSQIADGVVTSKKIDFSGVGNTCTTVWSGNLYQTGSANKVTLDEPLIYGRPYVITAYGLSGTYLMEFIFTCRSASYQAAYYDGANSCRWRINFMNESGGGAAPFTQMYLDSQSTNMGTNTAILRVAKITPADIS